MEMNQILGIVLLAAGALDLVVGWFVVGPRAPASSRRVVVAGITASGLLLLAAGGALLAGVVPVG